MVIEYLVVYVTVLEKTCIQIHNNQDNSIRLIL